jgi:hypothetical protein
MQKLFYLFLLFPFLAVGQTEAVLNKEFIKKSRGITTSFKLNEDVNIMQIDKKGNFDLLAVNEQMKVLWQVNLEGYPISAGKLKDKIVAVVNTDYSAMKNAYNNIYKGYIINSQTGIVELEKIFYNGSENFKEKPSLFFTEDGSYVKMTVAKTALANKLRAFSGPLVSLLSSKLEKQANTLTNYLIVDFDKELNVANITDISFPEGVLLGQCFNSNGNLTAVCSNSGQSLTFLKYISNKSEPISRINVPIPSYNKFLVKEMRLTLYSSPGQDVVYAGIMYPNNEKESQMSIIKCNFNNDTFFTATEVFNKDHIKYLEKTYIPQIKSNKDYKLGDASYLNVESLREVDDKLVAKISGRRMVTVSGSYASMVYFDEYSQLFSIYDSDLKLKHQQILPSNSSGSVQSVNGYQVKNNLLTIIATPGMVSTLNVENGQWEKMAPISIGKKQKLQYGSSISGSNILWFKNNCLIPYVSLTGLTKSNYQIDLLQQAL